MWATKEGKAQWEERGKGYVQFLRNLETNQVRVYLEDKKKKVCANFAILPGMSLTVQRVEANAKGVERSWTWHCTDESSGSPEKVQFAIKFDTNEGM